MVGGPAKSKVAVVNVYPDLLGTYGDGGNATILAKRVQSMGLECELIQLDSSSPVPRDADFYVLGGGEDGPQSLAARRLIQDGGLEVARDRGAVIFAVCAGFQILTRSFPGTGGIVQVGLGFINAETVTMDSRAVGEVLSVPGLPLGEPVLSGYENHGGGTILAEDVEALGEVFFGVGNHSHRRGEGAVDGKVICTYMHGPALARNVALADYLIKLRLGEAPDKDYSEDFPIHQALLNERIEAWERGGLRPTNKFASILAALSNRAKLAKLTTLTKTSNPTKQLDNNS